MTLKDNEVTTIVESFETKGYEFKGSDDERILLTREQELVDDIVEITIEDGSINVKEQKGTSMEDLTVVKFRGREWNILMTNGYIITRPEVVESANSRLKDITVKSLVDVNGLVVAYSCRDLFEDRWSWLIPVETVLNPNSFSIKKLDDKESYLRRVCSI